MEQLISFSEILGQERPKKIIKQAISRGKLAHAYIFTGIPGIGKTSMARILAMTLNCNNLSKEIEPCGECKPCRQMKSGNFPQTEFFIVRPKKKDDSIFKDDDYKDMDIPSLVISIKHIREVEHILSFPPLEKYRVLIIDQPEKMPEEAANTILKILEEPPSGNILILKTEFPHMLLPTVISRCQIIAFQPLQRQVLVDWLIGKRAVDKDKAMLLAKLSFGSLGRSLKMLDGNFLTKREEWLSILIKLIDKSKAEAIEIASKYEEEKNINFDLSKTGEAGTIDMLGVWEQWYRDLLLIKFGNSDDLLINMDYSKKLKNIAVKFKVENLIDCLDAIERAEQDLKRNLNEKILLEQLLLNFQNNTGQ